MTRSLSADETGTPVSTQVQTLATSYAHGAAPAWSQAEPDTMSDPYGKPMMAGRAITNGIALGAAIYAVMGGLAWLVFH
jgi:hypothetical protein